ncbi:MULTISPECIES: hypothetical protein [unclassified Nocardia]
MQIVTVSEHAGPTAGSGGDGRGGSAAEARHLSADFGSSQLERP